ncbi:MAG: (d)CMP kinase [Christensenellaceae bacterium]|jgi:cytidylate kinase|nr:(d)CMP kinase [Christensenellaceae bacterium]
MLNIAIDGPAGAGKSTIAKLIAKKYAIAYLDTGAMYRALAYHVIQMNIKIDDHEKINTIVAKLDMDVSYVGEEQHVFVCNQDVTQHLRGYEMGLAASDVSKIPSVRLRLVDLQREIAARRDCVLDGRDIGSFVLPNATIKFFLTADIKERARRRFVEFKEKGIDTAFETVLKDIEARDAQDSSRALAPLKIVSDAIIVDSTQMTLEDVFKTMSKRIDEVINRR